MTTIKQWLNNQRRKFWTRWYTFQLRKQDRNICCCGGCVDKCNPWCCGAQAVSQVDWSIHCAVAFRMGEKP